MQPAMEIDWSKELWLKSPLDVNGLKEMMETPKRFCRHFANGDNFL